jgi:ankyrin repeat protein
VAAREGWEDIVLALLEMGAAPDYTDSSNDMPVLLYAAQSGDVNTVKLLQREGTSPNAKGLEQRTPLSWASGLGHVSVV